MAVRAYTQEGPSRLPDLFSILKALPFPRPPPWEPHSTRNVPAEMSRAPSNTINPDLSHFFQTGLKGTRMSTP